MSTTMIVILSVIGFLALAGTVCLYMVVPAFRQWANTRGKDILLDMLRKYVFEQVKAVGEREWQAIAQDVLSGKLSTKDQIKTRLYDLGNQVREKVKTEFGSDLDILGDKADQILDTMIRSAADATSPFPGKETAAALLEDGVSDLLIKNGVDYLRN